MLYNIVFLCLFSVSLFSVENDSSESSDILNALIELNAEYDRQEYHEPREGYRVEFEEHPKFRARLIPMGSLRKTAQLSGIPDNDEFYRTNHCPFCTKQPKVFRPYDDHCRAIISQSGQILLIPDEHYNHWFEVPLEEQLKLLKHALVLRQLYSNLTKAPIGLHCGSAAFQTVFHVHLRTGIRLSADAPMR